MHADSALYAENTVSLPEQQCLHCEKHRLSEASIQQCFFDPSKGWSGWCAQTQ